jgi:hypothetical protein
VLCGGLAYTFGKARGIKIGTSLCEDDMVDTAFGFITEAEGKGVQLDGSCCRSENLCFVQRRTCPISKSLLLLQGDATCPPSCALISTQRSRRTMDEFFTIFGDHGTDRYRQGQHYYTSMSGAFECKDIISCETEPLPRTVYKRLDYSMYRPFYVSRNELRNDRNGRHNIMEARSDMIRNLLSI